MKYKVNMAGDVPIHTCIVLYGTCNELFVSILEIIYDEFCCVAITEAWLEQQRDMNEELIECGVVILTMA